MSEKLKLKATKRDILGKKLAEARKAGKLPAVFYGPKTKSQSIFLDFGEFKKAWKKAGESTLIALDVEGKEQNVLIQDVDRDPLRGEPVHVDFYVVDLTKKITATVPLVFEGIAPAVKNLGGVLVNVLREVEVEALPDELPHDLKVDLTPLETFEDKITVADIKTDAGVTLTASAEDMVAFVETVKEEEVEEETSIDDIEVTSEKKDDEDGGGGEEKKGDEAGNLSGQEKEEKKE